MPTFEYIALDTTGRRTSGVLAGPSEQSVLTELEARRLTPVSIETREEVSSRGRGVSRRRLATAYTQIAELLDAGVPLMRSLRIVGHKRSDPRLASIFQEIADAVSEGSDLAAAMQRRPEVFPNVHVAMIRAGEKGGFLERVLQRLAQLVTSQADLRSKVVGSLIYPMFLVGAGVIALGVIFGFFVPQFRQVFDQVQGGLPWVTRLVLAMSDVVASAWIYLLTGGAVAGVVGWRLSRRASVQRTLARWKTIAPIIGPLVRSLATARFCRMLGTMLANSVPMLAAMTIAREAAGNIVIEEAIAEAANSVKEGKSLSAPLEKSGLFEQDVIEMIAVAESANNLDHVLLKIADTIEVRVDRMLATALKLVEPVLLMGLAAVVATVAFALILPMTKVSAGL